jgi:hypothetical protein
MLTNKITGFSADLLNTVRGILGEAKKCPADCECEKCEAEEMKEGSMPTADEPTDANKKIADKDLRSEGADVPFDPPYSKPGERKDTYGNKVKNVAKYLAKKAMNDLAKKNEEVEHNNCGTPECCGQCDTPGQIDEISKNTLKSYVSKANDQIDRAREGQLTPAEAAKNRASKKKIGDKRIPGIELAVNKYYGRTKVAATNEEVDEIEESAKVVDHLIKRYGDNIRKSHVRSAANDFGVDASKLAKAVRTKLGKNMLDEEDDGWYTHSQMHGSKKSEKHPKGISAAEWKSGIRWHHGKNKRINIKEEVEQIDELSKGTMGRYINKAATKMGSQGVTAGLKIAADEKSSKNFKDMGKREKGIKLAVSKLTKEEQDFVDSLNADTLDEARGRPRKAGAKDFTIHPKTKEKLMHNNPAHMKTIEILQKNGILEKPKVEAGQHIMNQLSKAKTSMLGGSKIHFTHGDSKEVSGTHAAKILTKYAGMKPNDKEDFQKFVGHSHENLMKHV